MSYGSRKRRGLWPKGVWPTFISGVYRRARHKHFVVLLCEQRTTDTAVSTRRLPPFVAALFYTLRDSYGWQHCRLVCSEARYSSRIAFFAYTTCIRRPPLGGRYLSEYRQPVWYGKTKLVWLPIVKNFEDMFIRFDIIHERDRHTDGQTPHDGTGLAYA